MSKNGLSPIDMIARSLRAAPLRFVCAWSQETTLRPCPRHDHPVMELVYHPSGRGVTTLSDGEEMAFTEGSVVLYAARVAHDQRQSLAGADVCVHAEVPARVAKLLPRAACHPPVSDPYVGEEFWSLSRAHPRADAALAAALDLRVSALLLRLLAAADHDGQSPDPQAAYLRRARQYLQDHFTTVPDMGAVASHVGISEDYLRHLFKEREGVTMNQVLTRVRIERAKDLLRHSRLPLKGVAEQCGFQNERYFCMRFSALVGLTPGEFRNQPRGQLPPPLPGSA